MIAALQFYLYTHKTQAYWEFWISKLSEWNGDIVDDIETVLKPVSKLIG